MAKAKKVIQVAKKEVAKKTMKKASVSVGIEGFRAHKVTLNCAKMPGEGEVPVQAEQILGILKNSGGLTPDELIGKMEKVIKSKQSMRKVLNLHRAKLHKAGFLQVTSIAA